MPLDDGCKVANVRNIVTCFTDEEFPMTCIFPQFAIFTNSRNAKMRNLCGSSFGVLYCRIQSRSPKMMSLCTICVFISFTCNICVAVNIPCAQDTCHCCMRFPVLEQHRTRNVYQLDGLHYKWGLEVSLGKGEGSEASGSRCYTLFFSPQH